MKIFNCGKQNLVKKLGEIEVTITAEEGVLTKGTKLFVDTISGKDADKYLDIIEENNGIRLANTTVFDINLANESGRFIQPDGGVEVSFSGLDFEVNKNILVYHVEDKKESNARPSMMAMMSVPMKSMSSSVDDMRANVSRGKVKFHTDHFSIYAVGEKATASYEFYVGEDLKDTQIVLDGEELEEPETPEKIDGKKFAGWRIKGEPGYVDFSQEISIPVTDPITSITIEVNAVYEDTIKVFFMYGGNIIKTKELVPEGTTNDNDVPLVVTEDGKALLHWSETEKGVAFDFNNQITKDTNLYAVLADRWEVTFDTQGGNLLLPKYFEDGEVLGNIKKPIRLGYNFLKWNTNADGTGDDYTESTVIDENIKLHAIWKENLNTPYTVAYWQENANDDEYTFKEVISMTGMTGANADYQNKNYPGFELNSAKTDTENTVIKGDGSSVKNVYYDRKTWTLDFQTKIKDGDSGWPFYNPIWTWTSFSTTAIKQGADTSQWWDPEVVKYPDNLWFTEKNGNTFYTLAPDMPNNNLTVYGRSSGNTKYTVFYLEQGTNTNVHAPYEYTGSNNVTLTQEDLVAFLGFTVKSKLNDIKSLYIASLSVAVFLTFKIPYSIQIKVSWLSRASGFCSCIYP